MRITPTQTSFSPGGAAPTFRVDTGDYRYFAVQVATHAFLLNGSAAGRRSQDNFFDSWIGDDAVVTSRRGARREVAGEHLEAPTGTTTYTLPDVVWKRLSRSPQLFYRLLVSHDARLRRPHASVADVDWKRAPAVSVSRVPARPTRNAASRLRGGGVLSRADFLDQAQRQAALSGGVVQGRDGDFRYVLLDARQFAMTVLECHDLGLIGTVDHMPRKPAAVINGQFIGGLFGGRTEGEVIREGEVINSTSEAARSYIAETWRGTDIRDYHVGEGDPSAAESQARVAFGGLGPVLQAGRAPARLTQWARSIYDERARVGRGVIAFHRERSLILLLVQESHALWASNATRLAEVRDLLLQLGFDDAVFNDGSDSESLYAGGGWLLTPGSRKNSIMEYAVSFVDKRASRRLTTLAIDGTTSPDGQAFAHGVARPAITHFAPHNLDTDLHKMPALSSIAGCFHDGIVDAGKATTQAQADAIGGLIQQAGRGGAWADILYVSSHAWRHGQLWYHLGGGDHGPQLYIADLWSTSFRPAWRATPRWLIIGGCAVLAMRYTRGVALDRTERDHLVNWHQDMHGSGASVPGLTSGKQTLFAVYHPGWSWYQRIFRTSGLRGVLGYWWRSPGGGRDEAIVADFCERLRKGESFLGAWEAANRRGWFEAQAAWAAMVRDGCETDTLATLEDASLAAPRGVFKYYDRFQHGLQVPDAYRKANRLTNSTNVGSVSVQYNDDYDAAPLFSRGQLAIDELKALATSPTPANFLAYDDGMRP